MRRTAAAHGRQTNTGRRLPQKIYCNFIERFCNNGRAMTYLLPPLIIISVYNRGWFVALPITVVFVILPVLDWLSGVASIPREAPDLAFNNWFRIVTWLWVPVQVALIAWLVATVPMPGSSRVATLAERTVSATEEIHSRSVCAPNP